MQRREFIKTSCGACLGILGGAALLSALQSCAPLPMLKGEPENGVISVPVSSFAAEQSLLMINNPKMDHNILLVKKKDGTYNALYMQCTHQNQDLSANKSGLFCAAHGSAFDLDGNVTQAPADKPLRRFRTEADQTTIKIYLI